MDSRSPTSAKRNERVASSAGRNAIPFRSPKAPTEEDIRRLAYQNFIRRGNQPGDPISDWLKAERELRAMPATQESPSATGYTQYASDAPASEQRPDAKPSKLSV